MTKYIFQQAPYRQSLNYLISFELIACQIFMATFNPYIKLLPLLLPNVFASILIILNALLLKKYQNIRFSGYALTSIFYALIFIVNLLVGGAGTTVFFWFYTIPIIAAATIGIRGLLIFTSLIILTLFGFMLSPIKPILGHTVLLSEYIQLIDYFFILLLITTVIFDIFKSVQNL